MSVPKPHSVQELREVIYTAILHTYSREEHDAAADALKNLIEQMETVRRVAKEAVAYYIADVVPDREQRYVDDWCDLLSVTREELDALYWSDEPHVSSPASERQT